MAKRKRDSEAPTGSVRVSFIQKEDSEIGPVIGMLQLFIDFQHSPALFVMELENGGILAIQSPGRQLEN
jgi:hypothetical protein